MHERLAGLKSLDLDSTAVAGLQVLGRHRPSAHANRAEPIALPDGVNARRPARVCLTTLL